MFFSDTPSPTKRNISRIVSLASSVAFTSAALVVAPHASGGPTDRFSCPTPLGAAEITFNDSAGIILYVDDQELYPDFGNSPDGRFTYVVAVGDNSWTFERTPDDQLTFSQDGGAVFPCEQLAQLPGFDIPGEGGNASQDYVSVQGNFSLGGNVRSGPGPGTDFADIDSLPLGEPIVLVNRTGVTMDGYEWFEIEYSEGLRGFQWGGIMCSNALHIIGLYDPCPPEVGGN